MTLRTDRLRLRTVDRVTGDPVIDANRAALAADLVERGYDETRAAELAELARVPELLVAFAGSGTRRSDLPGYRPPEREGPR